MNCPNCGSKAHINFMKETVANITCPCCLFSGDVEDKAARKARIEAEATAAADTNIREKIKEAVDKLGSDIGEKVFEQNIAAILEIKTECGAGSGFLINKDFAITNTHVIINDEGKVCENIKALAAGQWVAASVIAVFGAPGTLDDIAIIKLSSLPRGVGRVELGDSDQIKTGQQSFVIGNSRGMGTCIMSGIISDKNREGFVLTNDMAKHGNSGGPLFTRDGKVFAVLDKGVGHDYAQGTTSGKSADVIVAVEVEGMNLSIPINHVKKLIRLAEKELAMDIL